MPSNSVVEVVNDMMVEKVIRIQGEMKAGSAAILTRYGRLLSGDGSLLREKSPQMEGLRGLRVLQSALHDTVAE